MKGTLTRHNYFTPQSSRGNKALGHSNEYADAQSTLVNVLQLLGKKRKCKISGPIFLKLSYDFRLFFGFIPTQNSHPFYEYSRLGKRTCS